MTVKVQVKNRDLSILMITLFGELQKKELEELKATKPKRYEGIKAEKQKIAQEKRLVLCVFLIVEQPWIAEEGLYILEALAASGLRSIRYWKEIPNIRRIIINDIADAAVESMKDNLAFNNITSDRVVPNQG